jgi:hypothetical protein
MTFQPNRRALFLGAAALIPARLSAERLHPARRDLRAGPRLCGDRCGCGGQVGPHH